MPTTKKAFISESFLIGRAINPIITENWDAETWKTETAVAALRWEKVRLITTKPKGQLAFSEDYNLIDTDACLAVGRQIEYLKLEPAAKMTTIKVNGNVYRVSRF